MKVLALNGSPHKDGNTALALKELGKSFASEGVELEIFWVGNKPIRDCTSCQQCSEIGCVFADDQVNKFVAMAKEADGIVIASPVYYAHPSGAIISFLDRVFYSSSRSFAGKVGASIAVARRAGTCATFYVLNKYFGISGMPIAASTYWNIGFGQKKGEFAQDAEGIQTMHNLAKNMAWLIKSIRAGRNAGIDAPEYELGNWMNFVR